MTFLAPYRGLFSLPASAAFSGAAFLARLPIAMLGLGSLLLVQDRTGSYARGGAVAASLALAAAFAGPLLARVADRVGQARLLVPSVLGHVVALVALIGLAAADAPLGLTMVAAGVTGALAPQIGSMVRVRWNAGMLLAGRAEAVPTAYAFESVLDEVIFVCGPVLVTGLAAALDPVAGLVVALVCVGTGTLWFAAQRGTEPAATPRPAAGDRPRPVHRIRGMQVLILASVFDGAVFGAAEVAMVAFAREQGHRGLGGLLLACVALGSLVSGLVYGTRAWKRDLWQRYALACTGLAVGGLLVLAAPTLPLMAAAGLVAGLAIAPTIIAGNGLVERLVPAAALTEGFTWVVTAVAVGLSLGSPVAGIAVDHAGSRAGFGVLAGAGVLCAVVAAAGRRPLQSAVAEQRSVNAE